MRENPVANFAKSYRENLKLPLKLLEILAVKAIFCLFLPCGGKVVIFI